MSPLTLEDRIASLEQQVADLRASREEDRQRLERATAAFQAERDLYLRSLYAWAQEQFTADESSDCVDQGGVDFGQLLDELERQYGLR
jgi:hypothetical protein